MERTFTPGPDGHGSASPGASTTASQALLGLLDAAFQTSAISFQSRHSGGDPDVHLTVHPEPEHSAPPAVDVVAVVAAAVVVLAIVAVVVSAAVVVMVDVPAGINMDVDVLVVVI